MQQQSMFEFMDNATPDISSLNALLGFLINKTSWPEDEKIMSDIKITRAFITQNIKLPDAEPISEPETVESDDSSGCKEMDDDAADFQTVCSMNLTQKGISASFFFFGKKTLAASCRKDNHIIVDISNEDFPQEQKWVSSYKAKKNAVSFDLHDVTDWDQFVSFLRSLKDKKFRMLTPDSIACCNEYLDCSNNGGCIKPHWLLSIKCFYRTNLENGRIFFGEERTLD